VLRITWYRNDPIARLKAEGEITGAESGVFWRECRKGIASGRRFEIDLRDVGYLDNEIADGLRELVRWGAHIVDSSPFVWAMLNTGDGVSDGVGLLSTRKPNRRRRNSSPKIV
jgi:hypothetical protein